MIQWWRLMNASHTASYRVTLRIYLKKNPKNLPVVFSYEWLCVYMCENCGGEKGIGKFSMNFPKLTLNAPHTTTQQRELRRIWDEIFGGKVPKSDVLNTHNQIGKSEHFPTESHAVPDGIGNSQIHTYESIYSLSIPLFSAHLESFRRRRAVFVRSKSWWKIFYMMRACACAFHGQRRMSEGGNK